MQKTFPRPVMSFSELLAASEDTSILKKQYTNVHKFAQVLVFSFPIPQLMTIFSFQL